MQKFLFSSSIGTFVFDESFRVLLEIPFDVDHQLEYGLQISEGSWIAPEEQAIRQHGPLIIIGFKEQKRTLQFTTDITLLAKLRDALRSRLFEMAKADVLLAKQLVKRSVSSDEMVLEASRSIKEFEKAINLLVKRLRTWYELYNPESSRAIFEHELFVAAILAKNKDALLADLKLTAKESMGAAFSEHDLSPIRELAEQTRALMEQKERTKKYVSSLMERLYPNISAVATPLIAAELLAYAGSLRKLAMMPSSTIQLLGAEKALFKHLKNKAIKPPKHGVIVNHPLMSKVDFKKRGRLARVLADKISIATRLDYFKGEFKGEELLKQVEQMVLP